jgi:GTPase SAR1 family protein
VQDHGLDFADEVARQFREKMKDMQRVNVVIAGRSGVGKSTLINAVFQGNVAETGQGRPVTSRTTEYIKDGLPLAIMDTRGLEMDRYHEAGRGRPPEAAPRCLDLHFRGFAPGRGGRVTRG